MAGLKKAAKALADYDKRKMNQANELTRDMPAVQLYIETHRPVWIARRGPSRLDKPLAC